MSPIASMPLARLRRPASSSASMRRAPGTAGCGGSGAERGRRDAGERGLGIDEHRARGVDGEEADGGGHRGGGNDAGHDARGARLVALAAECVFGSVVVVVAILLELLIVIREEER